MIAIHFQVVFFFQVGKRRVKIEFFRWGIAKKIMSFIRKKKHATLCVLEDILQKRKVLAKLLHSRGYDSDPVKAWKQSQAELSVSRVFLNTCNYVTAI